MFYIPQPTLEVIEEMVAKKKTAKKRTRSRAPKKMLAKKKTPLNKAKRKKLVRKKAREKVPQLFKQAQKNPNQRIADRLVRRARRLAMKFRMSLQPHKHTFCTTCYSRLIPGTNSRVRVHEKKIVYSCFVCGAHKRIPLTQKHKRASK